jgi:hypothetical protein
MCAQSSNWLIPLKQAETLESVRMAGFIPTA